MKRKKNGKRLNAKPRPGEIWRPLPRRHGGYEVSNFGRVRRLAFAAPRRRCGTQHYRAFVLKPYRRFGSPVVQLCVGPRRHCATRVAVLVAEAFLPPRPRDAVLVFRNGDHRDVRPGNLRWKR